jgi:hypothetical protein
MKRTNLSFLMRVPPVLMEKARAVPTSQGRRLRRSVSYLFILHGITSTLAKIVDRRLLGFYHACGILTHVENVDV